MQIVHTCLKLPFLNDRFQPRKTAAQRRAGALVLDASMRNGSNSEPDDDDENNNGGHSSNTGNTGSGGNGGDKRRLHRGDWTRGERVADRVICTCACMLVRTLLYLIISC